MAFSNKYKNTRSTLRRTRKLLVGTEGHTEVDYIDSHREQLRIPGQIVLIFKAKGTDPLSIVEDVKNRRDLRIQEKLFDPHMGDMAFAVFDVDEHCYNPATVARFNSAVQLADAEKIFVVSSNPCIENWLNLHYELNCANHTRVDARFKLKTRPTFLDYDKRIEKEMLKELFSNNQLAALNADEQFKRALSTNNGDFKEDLNPYTKVFKLIRIINQISEKYKS